MLSSSQSPSPPFEAISSRRSSASDSTSPLTVVACGGSIESRRCLNGHKRVVGGIDAIVAATGRPAEVRRFALRPSFAFDVGLLVQLARFTTECAGELPPVVSFGTDLMEEAAFVLDLLAPPCGVVLTGAAGDGGPESDAVANLGGALDLAAAGIPGYCAFLWFAGSVRRGHEVVEDRAGVDPFALGSGLGRAAALPRPAVPSKFASVAVLEASPASPPAVPDTDVVVVRAFAAGNVSPALAELLEERAATGRAVVLCSTLPSVGAAQTSSALGGGGRLLAAGALHAGPLSPRKAAVLAALAFGEGGDPGSFDAVVRAIA